MDGLGELVETTAQLGVGELYFTLKVRLGDFEPLEVVLGRCQTFLQGPNALYVDLSFRHQLIDFKSDLVILIKNLLMVLTLRLLLFSDQLQRILQLFDFLARKNLFDIINDISFQGMLITILAPDLVSVPDQCHCELPFLDHVAHLVGGSDVP